MIDHVAEPPTSPDDAMLVVTESWQELTRQLGLARWVSVHLIQYKHPHTIAHVVREHYKDMPYLPDLDWFITCAAEYDVHVARELGGHVVDLYRTDTLVHKVRKLFLASPEHTFCSNASIAAWVEKQLGYRVSAGPINKAKQHARILLDLDADSRAYEKGRPELVALTEPSGAQPHWRLQCRSHRQQPTPP